MPFTLFAMSVEEMAQQTLNTNPQIRKHISELHSLEYDLEKAYSAYKPSVNIHGEVGPEKTIRRGTGVDDQTKLIASKASLTLSENLFYGFNTTYDVKEQKSRIESAKYFTLQEANFILLKFITSYLDIIKNKQILNIEYENVKTHERINRKIRERTELGYGNIADVKQSEARKILAYSNYIIQQNNYRDSLFNFEHYFGKIILGNQMPEATNADLPTYNFDELIELALQYNPTIKIEEFNIKAQNNKYSKSLSSFYPSLDAEVSLDYTNNVDAYKYEKQSAKAMLKLNYNLYNGGYDESIRLQNLETKTVHQYSYQENKRSVIEKLKLAFISYIHNKKRIKCLKAYVKISQSTAESYLEEYSLGRRTLLDLLNVKQEYTQAQKQLINAQSELFKSSYRILDALGITTSALNTDIYDTLRLKRPEFQKSTNFDKQTDLQDIDDDTVFIDMDSACAEPVTLDLSIIVIDETNLQDIKRDFINVQFEFSSAEFSEDSKENIRSLTTRLLENNQTVMEIHGHTDNLGPDTYNEELSIQRAQSAKDVLTENGIEASRIKIFGHGSDEPVATNETEEGRALNRRIEFIIKNKDTEE